MTQIHFSSKYH